MQSKASTTVTSPRPSLWPTSSTSPTSPTLPLSPTTPFSPTSASVLPRYKKDAPFLCGVCDEDFPRAAPYVLLTTDKVCKECFVQEVKPKLLAAIDSEGNYPVCWGSANLAPDDLPDFDESFRKAWKAKVQEYETPKPRRLYCRHFYTLKALRAMAIPRATYEQLKRQGRFAGVCQKFLGEAEQATLAEKKSEEDFVSCAKCKGLTCKGCGTPRTKVQGLDHECDPDAVATSLATAIDETLVRGIDYQICPNEKCMRIRNLAEGCNAMTCECRTQYCYICGKIAHHDSGHWKPGGCPRWNQPGTDVARNDAPESPPLRFDPQITAEIAAARARIQHHTGVERQAIVDYCDILEQQHHCMAHLKRTKEHFERDGIAYWDWSWEEPVRDLLSAMGECVRYKHYGGKALPSPKDDADLGDVGKKAIEIEVQKAYFEFRWQLFRHARIEEHLRQQHPAIFGLFTGLEGLMRRVVMAVKSGKLGVEKRWEVVREWREVPDEELAELSWCLPGSSAEGSGEA